MNHFYIEVMGRLLFVCTSELTYVYFNGYRIIKMSDLFAHFLCNCFLLLFFLTISFSKPHPWLSLYPGGNLFYHVQNIALSVLALKILT